MGTFIQLNDTGDTKTIWDADSEEEVKAAEETFEKLKNQGYVAYKVDENGKKGEVMHTFDPQAGRVILAPGIVGG